jgi:IMP dehydrogenase
MLLDEDGLSARELFRRGRGIAYDDFIILPGHIDFHFQEVELVSRFSRRIELRMPFVSSPMDTVTEHRMAIALALQGGIGVIHYNNSPAEQAAEVRRVKRFENGFITEPVCLSPRSTIADVDAIKHSHGFSGIPITEDGTLRTRVVGIVTNRDIEFEPNRTKPLSEVMTGERHLVTARAGISLQEANKILRESKKGKLPLVDPEGRLVSLVSRRDLLKNRDYPEAA